MNSHIDCMKIVNFLLGEGDLGHFWPGYDIYRTVDYLYNDLGQHFGPSQSVLNLFEDLIYVVALFSSGISFTFTQFSCQISDSFINETRRSSIIIRFYGTFYDIE
jgi:hypothetical protein